MSETCGGSARHGMRLCRARLAIVKRTLAAAYAGEIAGWYDDDEVVRMYLDLAATVEAFNPGDVCCPCCEEVTCDTGYARSNPSGRRPLLMAWKKTRADRQRDAKEYASPECRKNREIARQEGQRALREMPGFRLPRLEFDARIPVTQERHSLTREHVDALRRRRVMQVPRDQDRTGRRRIPTWQRPAHCRPVAADVADHLGVATDE